MNDFYKASALVLVSVILCVILSGQNKHYSLLISVLVCAFVGIAAMVYIKPVLDFLEELKALGQWNSDLFSILMRSASIGIVMHIVTLLCADAGNTALGKSIQFLGSSVILWVSLPLFTELLDMINQLLESL